jgi:hypothetical protein
MYRSLIVNYDNLGMVEMDCSTNYDYIMISPQIFTPAANTLALYLNQHGHSVQVITEDASYWEEIYGIIQNCYSQYHNSFVLLFGDENFIPIPTIQNPAYNDQIMGPEEIVVPTDTYYGDVDYSPPDCPSPDVIVGRLSVSNQNKAALQVNKIKQHYDNWDPDLELKNLLVAHGQELVPPWGYGFPWVECKQYIQTFRYQITPSPTFTCIFGNDYFVDNQDIIDAINSGQMIVNYVGHGDRVKWLQWDVHHEPYPEDFGGPQIQQTNPGPFRPVIFSASCLTGDISSKSSCMSEMWMNALGGAVGVIGSTRTVYAEQDILFDKWLYKALYGWAQGCNVVPCLGIVQDCAKMEIVEEYYGTCYWPYVELLYHEFLLLGDPSLWMLPQIGTLGANNQKEASEQKIKSTECSQLEPMLNLYPNPVSENMTVHITDAQPGPVSLKIYDLSGRLISDQQLIAGEGDNYFDVDCASLNIKSGIYIVKLSASDLYQVRRIVFTK